MTTAQAVRLTHINLVLNWFEALKTRAPATK
jgi:hypothetical protein